MKVFAILNRKGGTGKTTTAVNLAAALAIKGKKTLLIDADPQANASLSVGVLATKGMHSLGKLLLQEIKIRETIYPTYHENLKVIPSIENLAKLDPILINTPNSETLIKRALEDVEKEYEYVIIDCPPYVGIINLSVLFASQNVIIPLRNDFLSLEGLAQVTNVIDRVSSKINADLKIGGVLITMYDDRDKIIDVGRFSSLLFPTAIRYDRILSEAPKYGKPIFGYAENSPGAEDYRKFADEFLARFP
ncbi:MAG TPA: sporulation initiation inhibitor Soj [Spirochaetia bacterium]|nr:sporulation initiation inhibitor Soj [Spirochaetia bacterium]